MNPNERLSGLTPFVYAARSGSFAAAAVQLNLTPSAVGKSVARMEQRLGTRLFERTTRHLSLTDAGQAYFETCLRVLNDLTDAQAVLASHALTPMGRLRIITGVPSWRHYSSEAVCAARRRNWVGDRCSCRRN